MKILVYGAGPLGCLLAVRLQQVSQDVSILARGEWLDAIRQHGIIMEDLISGERTTTQIDAVEVLTPEDTYDWIMVVMGKEYVPAILPILATNRGTPNVLFLGNNIAGSGDYIDALGCERVLMGFLGAVGTREDGVVKYVSQYGDIRASVRIGELDGCLSPRIMRIGKVLDETGFDVYFSDDIDAWLKTHAVFILGLAGAYNMADRDIERLVNTRDVLVMMVRAIREGMRVLRAHDVPILPKNLKMLIKLPEPVIVFWLKKWMSGEGFKYALIHGKSARPEMLYLSKELANLIQTTNVRTPYIDILRVHMQSGAPKMPKGSDVIHLRWREMFLPLVLIASLIGGGIGVAKLVKRKQ